MCFYADDVIGAYEAAIDGIDAASGKAYNIKGGPEKTLSLLELAELLGSELGRPVRHDFAECAPATSGSM